MGGRERRGCRCYWLVGRRKRIGRGKERLSVVAGRGRGGTEKCLESRERSTTNVKGVRGKGREQGNREKGGKRESFDSAAKDSPAFSSFASCTVGHFAKVVEIPSNTSCPPLFFPVLDPPPTKTLFPPLPRPRFPVQPCVRSR